ncbi:MAG: hypothetical protein J0H53_05505 [Rhizobiales bacterium]|nr:hypothetical protein [Hyphomicrobiales bacterium]
MPSTNRRESGARKLAPAKAPDPADDFSQDAAANKPPRSGMGNSRPLDETSEKTRQSDGRSDHR